MIWCWTCRQCMHADQMLTPGLYPSSVCRCAELAEKTRAELQLYVKQKTDEILNLNNQARVRLTQLPATC